MAKIPIILEPGRADGKLVASDSIFDKNKNKFQNKINQEVEERLNDVKDTLNSDSTTTPLSAKQGKVLKELLDSKVIETGSIPIDSEPILGNTTHIVNSDGLAKEFNKCNTTIINTDRIANEAIVPSKLSTDIQSLISNLSKTATFAGIATPTTNPGTLNGHVFYIANGKGTYTNFGGIDVTEDDVVILYYDTSWHKNATGIASQEKLTELEYNKLNISDYCNPEDFIKRDIQLESGVYYDKDTLERRSHTKFSALRIDGVSAGVRFHYKCSIAYNSVAAVIFVDANNTIISRLYDDNTSTPVLIDIDLITPSSCKSVIFTAYIGNQYNPILSRYYLPKTLLSNNVVDIIDKIIYKDVELVSEPVEYKPGFYDGNTLVYNDNAQFTCAEYNVEIGDKVSYSGNVRYTNLYAVIFADANNTIIDRIGNNQSATEHIETGIIDVPKDATKVYFGCFGSSFEAFIYKKPAIINEVNIKEYIPNVQAKVKYVNAYHYVFGVNQQDDVSFNSFGNNYESKTSDSFMIHQKYFKSYKRKIEWRVKLLPTSVIAFGTNSQSSSSVVVNSRQSQFVLDIPSAKLNVLTSAGSSFASEEIVGFNSADTYIIRVEQFDYMQSIKIINERTLDVISSHSHIAHKEDSPVGNLLGYPFIKLNSGYIKLVAYDVYLMKEPTIVFVGDSITECGYRQHTYAAMFIEKKLNGDGCIIAQGGANIDTMGLSWSSEIPFMRPKYLSLLAGTNNTITTEQVLDWKRRCDEIGAIFIVNRIPVSKVPDTYPWDSKNTEIRAAGINGANFDAATALNNNPDDGADNSLFEDNVHLNAEGQQKMYERFCNDVQIIA